jgi:hypothetical protein
VISVSRRPVRDPVKSPDDTARETAPAAARTSHAVDTAPSTVVGTRGPVRPPRGLAGAPGRLILGPPRTRGIPSIDVIEFRAACPGCGRDVMWIEEREETRLQITVECRCAR